MVGGSGEQDSRDRETRKNIYLDHFIPELETLIQTGSHFESFTIARDQMYMCRAVKIGGIGAIAHQRFWQLRSPNLNREGR